MRWFPILILVCWLSACAPFVEHIDVNYEPALPAAPIPGAANIPVSLRITTPSAPPDERVGVKKNGYGIEMGGLATTRPIAEIIQTAFGMELQRRGFPPGPGGATISVDVNRFYNDFKMGFFVGGSVADVTLAVLVRNGTGTIGYARTVTGESTENATMVMVPSVARVQLTKALSQAMAKIFSDPEFIAALLGARPAAAQFNTGS